MISVNETVDLHVLPEFFIPRYQCISIYSIGGVLVSTSLNVNICFYDSRLNILYEYQSKSCCQFFLSDRSNNQMEENLLFLITDQI